MNTAQSTETDCRIHRNKIVITLKKCKIFVRLVRFGRCRKFVRFQEKL